MSEPGSPVTVRAERTGRLLTITLDRPEQANALDMSTARQLRDAVRLIDDGVGCVLLRAEGANFCVGGDVRAFAASPAPGEFLGELASVVHDAVLGLVSAAAPVVAAVHGWAAGAGMSLAACADITLAAESARFRSAYSAIGLSPDCGLTWTLPRLVGRARAADLMLTNRAVGAAEAAAIGLVARVVADDSLLARCAGDGGRAGVRPDRGLRPDQEAARCERPGHPRRPARRGGGIDRRLRRPPAGPGRSRRLHGRPQAGLPLTMA